MQAGRNSIALTEAEDRTIDFAEDHAKNLFVKFNKEASEYTIVRDAFGNLFITLLGKDTTKTVMSGSHADSVKDGGHFDGPVGVAAAMEFLQELLEKGQTPAQNYTVAVFRSEESSPATGLACLGSAIATGQITKAKLETLRYKKADGTSVLLSEHFTERYGAPRWAEVLEEIQHPPLNGETVAHYEEVHIEQSSVASLRNADLAVVSDGIGGSRRESVQVDPGELRGEEITSTKETPYEQFTIQILGYADHTGGAPHNGTDTAFDAKPIVYRRNALLGAVEVVERLTAPYYGGTAKALSLSVPAPTGFTTVPAHQTIELVAPAGTHKQMGKMMEELEAQLRQQGLEMSVTSEPVIEGTTLRTLETAQVLAATQVPKAVEQSVTDVIVSHQFTPTLDVKLPNADAIGKVRATVTDFSMSADRGLQFNIDQRNVDPTQAKKLSRSVDDALRTYLDLMGVEKEKVHRVISDVPHAPIDRQATETKFKIAALLGFEIVAMPSMPGHDAANMSKAGIPTTMTFVKHDGVSHNPSEFADDADIDKAASVSHGLLRELLKV